MYENMDHRKPQKQPDPEIDIRKSFQNLVRKLSKKPFGESNPTKSNTINNSEVHEKRPHDSKPRAEDA